MMETEVLNPALQSGRCLLRNLPYTHHLDTVHKGFLPWLSHQSPSGLKTVLTYSTSILTNQILFILLISDQRELAYNPWHENLDQIPSFRALLTEILFSHSTVCIYSFHFLKTQLLSTSSANVYKARNIFVYNYFITSICTVYGSCWDNTWIN